MYGTIYRYMSILGAVGMTGLLLVTGATAKSPTAPPTAVAKSPTCDSSSHPKITKVTPDPVRPGDKITIKGNKFGTKECFLNVSFGAIGTPEFKYVNETTVEATVPNLKPGLMPVHVLTSGGSSEFVLLIQTK
jgi:hypothetical protein